MPSPSIPVSRRTIWVDPSHPKSGTRGTTLAVSRGRLDGATLTDVREIFVADAWETSGNMAGRMLFGPDGTLYVAVGDRDRLRGTGTEDNSLRMKAQDPGNHAGKVLRITDRGGVPRTIRSSAARTRSRRSSPTAIATATAGVPPVTGELWQMEIGPQGGDEVNILKAGANYGWPLVSSAATTPARSSRKAFLRRAWKIR